MIKSLISTTLITALIALSAIGCNKETVSQNVSYEAQKQLVVKADITMKSLDWFAYAELILPADLEDFKANLLPEIEALSPNKDSVQIISGYMPYSYVSDSTSAFFFGAILNEIFAIAPEMSETFSGMDNEYVGAFSESEDLVHCIFRSNMDIGDNHIEEISVVTVTKVDGAWKVRMSNRIDGLALMIKRTLAIRKA